MEFFNYSGDNEKKSDNEITVLAELTEDDWQQLTKYTINIKFKAGEQLLKAGDTGDGVYILVSGDVEVIKKGSFGRECRITEIVEGSIFGELSFFDRQPRSADIKAITDGYVLHLTQSSFEKLAVWNPALAKIILFDLGRVLAYRFRQMTSHTL